ncbi:hypothetical protein ILUMI_03389 [Ignelater luminosus]|uniref:Ras-GEF domain-containing protein n=1 Tax=Ignelater luminosus TaxID=2038154 RepID=A0A8K0DAW0_IGNLU|nr:hypothetical protein ILUMI_03389 [Ignelater luminosus]
MSTNRIQKLLFSEYCDFEDMVLVESPFAQTTREGKGIRQVHLGLTPTKLVLATDVLPPANDSLMTYIPGVDPDIETFELVAVYPVECLNLSVFHRRKRQSLKAHFCNNRVLYFELGGFEKRQMFWNLWCERVKFLSPEDPGSSHSETSVATSTSNSTLYLLAARKVVTESGVPQLWCKFGGGDISVSNVPKWPDRHLYLGKNMEESPLNYTPLMNPPSASQFINSRKRLQKNIFSLPQTQTNGIVMGQLSGTESQSLMVNRFGDGVPNGCSSGLLLPIESLMSQPKRSNTSSQSTDGYILHSTFKPQKPSDFIDLTETAVRLWELQRDTNPNAIHRGRHRRRYGFAPHPHFAHGLGPWSVPPGERYSVQIKRAVSAVGIRKQPIEPELRLPVSRRQLVATISCEALHSNKRLNINSKTIKTALKRPVLFFWTPEYWYRPRSAKDAYRELLNHLKKVRRYCESKSKARRKGRRRFFRRDRFKRHEKDIFISDTEDFSEECVPTKKNTRRVNIFTAFKENHVESSDRETPKKSEETPVQYLRRILRMEISLTAWDFDSTTLACQLTLIDRDLFLKIPSTELEVLLLQQTSKNAPNIGAIEAFSHRISCLVTTEILRDDSEKIRARLIARLINTAEKCHKLSNFQSCRSILCGLQSPAIFRLHVTWTYVRKRHATKYQLYRDPRLPAFQKAFFRSSQEPPYLPYMGDLISRLLNRVPILKNSFYLNPFSTSRKPSSTSSEATTSDTKSSTQVGTTSTLRKILSTLRVLPPLEENTNFKKRRNLCRRRLENNYGNNKIIWLNIANEFLENCQRAASAYVLRKNDLATEYLLKARYREDKENFSNSFSVEKQYYIDSDYLCNF